MTAETVKQGTMLAIEHEGRWLFLSRAEAVELLDKLPSLISEMKTESTPTVEE